MKMIDNFRSGSNFSNNTLSRNLYYVCHKYKITLLNIINTYLNWLKGYCVVDIYKKKTNQAWFIDKGVWVYNWNTKVIQYQIET